MDDTRIREIATVNKAAHENISKHLQEASSISSRLENSVNFDMLFERAVEVFADQALLGDDYKNVGLKDLEVSKSKAANFLDAVAGFLEISHQAEILSAEKHKFKRKDELDILNSLMRSFKSASDSLEDTMLLTRQKMVELSHEGIPDPQDIAILQTVLQASVDTGQKLVNSVSRLIQVERQSGSRPWGNQRTPATNIAILDKIEAEKNADKAKLRPPVRELDLSDLEDIDL